MNTMMNYTIRESDAGSTVSSYLRGQGFSGRILASLKKIPGAFCLNGRPVFASHILCCGDILSVSLPETRESSPVTPVPMDLHILYEDDCLMVINKPAGVPVHPSQGNHGNTLADGTAWYMSQKPEPEPFVFRAVNRLDRDTSGLILVAKNRLAASVLSSRAGSHSLHREYAAIVCGRTDPSGTVSAPIGRKEGSVIERTVDPVHGESAVTRYVTLAYRKDADLSFLRLLLSTGRTHQIRVHMNHIGHPIPGDFLYCPDFRHIRRQALHSVFLRFEHPFTGKLLEFEAPLPEDMASLFPEFVSGIRSPFG